MSLFPACVCLNALVPFGSINGLICLSQFRTSDRVILWNISIKKHVELPRRSLRFEERFRDEAYWAAIGFGFDATSKDYKVVRITYALVKRTRKQITEVITLKTMDRGWKCVSSNGSLLLFSQAVFVNGNCHWFAESRGDDGKIRRMIVPFDLSKETFGVIKTPADLKWHPPQYTHLIVYKGLLGVTGTTNEHASQNYYYVWVMNEYNVAESWTKLCTISLTMCLRPIGSRNNGEVLFVDHVSGKKSYNPDTQILDLYSRSDGSCKTWAVYNLDSSDHNASEIKFFRTLHFRNDLTVSPYVDSLVLLDEPLAHGTKTEMKRKKRKKA